MSKRKLALNAILVPLLFLLFLPFAHAAVSEEQVQSVGGSSLTDAMPNSARQYLDGVSPENADTLSDSVSRVLENMTSDSQSAIQTALGGLLRVAVIVLLALLHLGIKNIHLGPTLPAFLSPGVARILTEKFGIQGITEPQKDMERMEIL